MLIQYKPPILICVNLQLFPRLFRESDDGAVAQVRQRSSNHPSTSFDIEVLDVGFVFLYCDFTDCESHQIEKSYTPCS